MKKKTSNPSADEIENLFRKKAEKLVWNIIDTHDYDDHIIENATLSIQELLEEYASLKQSELSEKKINKITKERFFELVNAWKYGELTGDEFYKRVNQFTHWQPLPAPPTNKEQPLDD